MGVFFASADGRESLSSADCDIANAYLEAEDLRLDQRERVAVDLDETLALLLDSSDMS